MFQNDLILGTRLTLNDTQDTAVLLTGAVDTTNGGVTLRLEAERRLTAQWKVEVEGSAFLNQDRSGLGGAFAEDSFLRITLIYSF